MDEFSGMKVIVVQPQRIWVRRSWRERLFTWECGWRPFAAMKMVTKELIPTEKCFKQGNTIYCGQKFYEELKKNPSVRVSEAPNIPLQMGSPFGGGLYDPRT